MDAPLLVAVVLLYSGCQVQPQIRVKQIVASERQLV